MNSSNIDQPIALLLNILSGGGAQRRIASLANRFAELGRAVDVVSVVPGGPMTSMLSSGVRVITLANATPPSFLSTAIFVHGLTRYLAEARPCVLMSCVTDTHLLAVSAARLSSASTPLVLRASRHPFRPIRRSRIVKRAIERYNLYKSASCYARADAIVSLSNDSTEGLRRLLGDRAKRIDTIYNPVVSAFSSKAPDRSKARVRRESPIILGVGRFVEQKDFTTLLNAFGLLRAERPARLVLLGSGPEERRLQRMIDKLGLRGSVDMPGQVDNASEWMRDADLLVSSSLWEGLQATLIEALAVGCPVVATDCPGGARETLRHGALGQLVPVRDPAAMARAMSYSLDNPLDQHVLLEGAARFTPDGKAEAYLSLFDALRR